MPMFAGFGGFIVPLKKIEYGFGYIVSSIHIISTTFVLLLILPFSLNFP